MNMKLWLVMSMALMVSATARKAPEQDATVRPPNAIKSITAQRCAANPLIDFKTSPSLGENINGPSVIKAPAWLTKPLGKFYMYFADHRGGYIRLAYADAVQGPWKIYEPGTLNLKQMHRPFHGHIASPDIHVDDQKREIRMYFHGQAPGGQKTGIATSKDGLTFKAQDVILGEFYFRVFQWQDWFYSFSKTDWGGLFARSKDGVTPFESRGNLIPRMRHSAVLLKDDQLLVFFTRVKDEPERVLVSTIALTGDWKTWQDSTPLEVIKPEKDYEGISYPKTSQFGPAIKVQQLRDPCIFQDEGHTYLFYTIAGEMGIAMAELQIVMKSKSELAGSKPAP